jgi:c-di-GMP-binding flagellar brake protein YcgR
MADNRRNDYRLSFRHFDHVSVELQTPSVNHVLAGEILDLSLGGMKVRIKERNLPLHSREPLTARSRIPGINQTTGLKATVVYSQSTNEGQTLGLQFLGLDDPSKNEDREKAMWLYLLDQQRAQRRRLMLQPNFDAAAE